MKRTLFFMMRSPLACGQEDSSNRRIAFVRKSNPSGALTISCRRACQVPACSQANELHLSPLTGRCKSKAFRAAVLEPGFICFAEEKCAEMLYSINSDVGMTLELL